jgi:NAD-dependent deacetylase
MHQPTDTDDAQASLEGAAQLLRRARRVAALTGAGISAESGLATFRGAGGLWEGQRVEDVATPRAFQRDPALVWRFYHARRAALRTAQPNPGHRALVQMEQLLGGDRFTLITQNVDGLHVEAGSQRVLELHGSLRRSVCTGCGVEYHGLEQLDDLPRCAYCPHLLRPNIVWFEEALPDEVWRAAELATGACDCFLVIGTSAIVYPAASLIPLAQHHGAKVIEVNLTRTAASDLADVSLLGPSGQVLPALVERWPAAS